MYSKEQIESAVKAKGYDWFDNNSDYNLNIVGIRNVSTGKKVSNLFDDTLTVSFKVNGVWQFKEWVITTDPGIKGVKEFSNPNGVARVVPGQYKSSHGIGLHQGKYEALKQINPMKVFRDKNKDLVFDESTIQEGIFGINIHKAGTISNFVENWSEGCQVFKRAMDFNEFMSIVKKSSAKGNKTFTYTLIQSSDI